MFDHGLYRLVAIVALAFAVIAALHFARPIFLPTALALLIALVLHLPMAAMQKARLPRAVSIAVLISVVALFIAFLYFLVYSPIEETLASYPQLVNELRFKLMDFRQSFSAAEQAGDAIKGVADDVTAMGKEPGVQEVVVKEPGFLTKAAWSMMDIATMTIVTLTITAFLMAMKRPFTAMAALPFATFAGKLNAARTWKNVEADVGHYFFVTSVINTCLGTVVAVALWPLGVPTPYVWGVIVGMLNFIPFVGPAIGSVALATASIILFDQPLQILAPPAVYLGINFIEANFVTPHFLGQRLNVAPLTIIIALLFWGWLWGFAGLLISVPSLVILKAIADRSHRMAPVRRVLAPRRAGAQLAGKERKRGRHVSITKRRAL